MTGIRIGQSDDRCVLIRHGCQDHGNSSSDLSLSSHAFDVSLLLPSLRREDRCDALTLFVERFMTELEEMRRSLSGRATLTLDGPPFFNLTGELGARGKLWWNGELRNYDWTLSFKMEDDQSSLPFLIASVKRLLHELIDPALP